MLSKKNDMLILKIKDLAEVDPENKGLMEIDPENKWFSESALPISGKKHGKKMSRHAVVH